MKFYFERMHFQSSSKTTKTVILQLCYKRTLLIWICIKWPYCALDCSIHYYYGADNKTYKFVPVCDKSTWNSYSTIQKAIAWLVDIYMYSNEKYEWKICPYELNQYNWAKMDSLLWTHYNIKYTLYQLSISSLFLRAANSLNLGVGLTDGEGGIELLLLLDVCSFLTWALGLPPVVWERLGEVGVMSPLFCASGSSNTANRK